VRAAPKRTPERAVAVEEERVFEAEGGFVEVEEVEGDAEKWEEGVEVEEGDMVIELFCCWMRRREVCSLA